MLYEQRPSRQFKGVFSSWVSWLWPTHCSYCTEVRLFQTVPRLHKKVIMLFVIRDPDSNHSEKKRLYFRKCRQGNQCCKNSAAIASKSKYYYPDTMNQSTWTYFADTYCKRKQGRSCPCFSIKPLESTYIMMNAVYQTLLLSPPLS